MYSTVCKNKYFVEFGAWDGKHFSNTAHLRDMGWKGLLMEGNLKKVKSVSNALGINLHHELIFPDNINDIFRKHNVPKNIGLLSIDIDGNDFYIWEALDLYYKPDVVIVEFNQGLPNHKSIKIIEQKKEDGIIDHTTTGDYRSANLYSLYDLAISKGYAFVTTDAQNIIFVRNDLFSMLGIEKYEKQEIMKRHSCELNPINTSEIIRANKNWVVD